MTRSELYQDAVAGAFEGLQEQPERGSVVAALRRLAEATRGLGALERRAARYEAVEQLKALGLPPEEARALASAALNDSAGGHSPSPEKGQGAALTWTDPEPWPDPVDGAELLDELVAVIRRYVVVPEVAAQAAALWVLLTHCLGYILVAVRLVLTSPTRECGKTRLLTLLSALVRRPLSASSVTPAVLFRVVEAHAPTLMLDEVDNARLNENAELRALLNSGHSRGTAYVLRTVGEDHEPRQFSTWCAIALAAIGNLPDTVTSRGVVLRLQRKPRGVAVSRLREARLHADLEPLRRRLTRWAADHGSAVGDADPDLPPALDGREADNWGALVALADAAGGEWPGAARRAALAFSGEVEEDDARVLLLGDLRELFAERGTDRLASEDMVSALARMDGRPWPEWRDGKQLTKRGLARLLSPFGIESRTIWLPGKVTAKGYHRDSFEDAFARYLPPKASGASGTAPIADEVTPLDASGQRFLTDTRTSHEPHEQWHLTGLTDAKVDTDLWPHPADPFGPRAGGVNGFPDDADESAPVDEGAPFGEGGERA